MPYPRKRMLYSRASSPLQSTSFMTTQLPPFPPFMQFDHPRQGPAITVTHLHLSPPPPDVPSLWLPLPSPNHVCSTLLTETKPRSASNPPPGWKTNWPAGTKFFLPARISSSLLYLKYSLSNSNFLVESGASVSGFSAPVSSSSSGIHPVTANGSAMTCNGFRIIPLLFSSKRFHWTFQLAPVSVTILGADFLPHHHPLLDVAGGLYLNLQILYLQVNPCPLPQNHKIFLSVLTCCLLLKLSRIYCTSSLT